MGILEEETSCGGGDRNFCVGVDRRSLEEARRKRAVMGFSGVAWRLSNIPLPPSVYVGGVAKGVRVGGGGGVDRMGNMAAVALISPPLGEALAVEDCFPNCG